MHSGDRDTSPSDGTLTRRQRGRSWRNLWGKIPSEEACTLHVHSISLRCNPPPPVGSLFIQATVTNGSHFHRTPPQDGLEWHDPFPLQVSCINRSDHSPQRASYLMCNSPIKIEVIRAGTHEVIGSHTFSLHTLEYQRPTELVGNITPDMLIHIEVQAIDFGRRLGTQTPSPPPPAHPHTTTTTTTTRHRKRSRTNSPPDHLRREGPPQLRVEVGKVNGLPLVLGGKVQVILQFQGEERIVVPPPPTSSQLPPAPRRNSEQWVTFRIDPSGVVTPANSKLTVKVETEDSTVLAAGSLSLMLLPCDAQSPINLLLHPHSSLPVVAPGEEHVAVSLVVWPHGFGLKQHDWLAQSEQGERYNLELNQQDGRMHLLQEWYSVSPPTRGLPPPPLNPNYKHDALPGSVTQEITRLIQTTSRDTSEVIVSMDTMRRMVEHYQEAARQLEANNHRFKEVHDQLNSLRKENTEGQTHISRLETEIVHYQRLVSDNQGPGRGGIGGGSPVSASGTEVILVQQVDLLQDDIKELEDQLHIAAEDHAELERQLRVADNHIHALKARRKELEKENNELKNELANMADRLHTAGSPRTVDRAMQDMREKLRKTEAANAQLCAQIWRVRTELKQWKSESEALGTTLSEERKQSRLSFDKLRERVKWEASELHSMKRALQKLEDNNAHLRAQGYHNSSQLSEKERSLLSLSADITEKEAMLSDLQQELSHAHRRLQQSDAETLKRHVLGELRPDSPLSTMGGSDDASPLSLTHVVELETKVRRYEEEVQGITRQKEHLETLQREIVEVEDTSKLQVLAHELELARVEVLDLRGQLAVVSREKEVEVEAYTSELEHRIAEQDRALDELRRDLQAPFIEAEQRIAIMAKDLEDARNTIRDLDYQLDRKMIELNDAHRKINILEENGDDKTDKLLREMKNLEARLAKAEQDKLSVTNTNTTTIDTSPSIKERELERKVRDLERKLKELADTGDYELNRQITEYKDKITRLTTERDDIREENDRLKQRVEHLLRDRQEEEDQLRKTSFSKSDFEMKLKQAKQDNEELGIKLRHITTALDEAEKRRTELEIALKRSHAREKELEDHLRHTEEDLEEMKQKNKRLDREVRNLRDDLKDKDQNQEDSQNATNRRVRELEGLLQDLQLQTEEISKRYQANQRLLDDAQDENDELKRKRDKLQSDIEVMKSRETELHRQLKDKEECYAAQLEKNQQYVEKLEKKYARKKGELKKLQEDSYRIEEELRRLNRDLKDSHSDEARRLKDQHSEEVRTLRDDKDRLEAEIRRLEQLLDSAAQKDKKLHELLRQMDDTNVELQKLEMQWKSALDDVSSKATQVAELEAELNKASKEIMTQREYIGQLTETAERAVILERQTQEKDAELRRALETLQKEKNVLVTKEAEIDREKQALSAAKRREQDLQDQLHDTKANTQRQLRDMERKLHEVEEYNKMNAIDSERIVDELQRKTAVLEQTVHEKDQLMAILDAELNEKAHRISDLETALAASADAEAAARELQNKDRIIAELEMHIHAKDDDVRIQTVEIQELEMQLRAERERGDALIEEITRLEALLKRTTEDASKLEWQVHWLKDQLEAERSHHPSPPLGLEMLMELGPSHNIKLLIQSYLTKDNPSQYLADLQAALAQKNKDLERKDKQITQLEARLIQLEAHLSEEKINENAMLRVSELEGAIAVLQDTIEQHMKREHELKQELDAVRHELWLRQQQDAELEGESANKDIMIQRLKQELAIANAKLDESSELSKQVDAAREELRNAMKDSYELKSDNKKLDENNKRLQKDVEELKSKLHELNDHEDHLDKNLSKSQHKINELESTIRNQEDQIERLTHETKDLKRKLKDQDETHSEETEEYHRLKSIVTELKKKLKDIQEREEEVIKEKDDEISHLKRKAKDANERLSQHEEESLQESSDLKRRLKEQQDKYFELQEEKEEEIRELKKKIKELQEKFNELTDERDIIQEKIQEYKRKASKVKELEDSLEEAHDTIDSMKKKMTKLNETKESLEEEIRRLEKELQDPDKGDTRKLREELKRLEERLQSERSTLESLHSKLLSTEEELARERRTNSVATPRHKLMEEELEKQADIIAGLRAESLALQEKLHEIQMRNQSLQNELQTQCTALGVARGQVAELNQTIGDMRAVATLISEIERQVALGQCEIERLEQELASVWRDGVCEATIPPERILHTLKYVNDGMAEQRRQLKLAYDILTSTGKPTGRAIEELERRLRELYSTIDVRDKRIMLLETECHTYHEVVHTEKEHSERFLHLEEQLNESQERSLLAAREQSRLQEELDRLNSLTVDLEAENARLIQDMEQHKTIENRIAGLEREAEIKVKELEHKLQQSLSGHRGLQEELIGKTAELDMAKIQIADLQSQLGGASNEQEHRFLMLQDEFQKRVDELEKLCRNARVHTSDLEGELISMRNLYDSKDDELKKLACKLDRQMRTNEDLRIQLNEATREVRSRTSHSLRQAELEELLAQKNGDLKRLHKRITDLDRERPRTDRTIEELKATLIAKDKTLQAEQQSRELLEHEIHALTCAVQTLTQSKSDGMARIANLEAELADLQNHMEKRIADVRSNEINRSASQVNHLSQQVKVLHQRLMEAQEGGAPPDSQELRERITELEALTDRVENGRTTTTTEVVSRRRVSSSPTRGGSPERPTSADLFSRLDTLQQKLGNIDNDRHPCETELRKLNEVEQENELLKRKITELQTQHTSRFLDDGSPRSSAGNGSPRGIEELHGAIRGLLNQVTELHRAASPSGLDQQERGILKEKMHTLQDQSAEIRSQLTQLERTVNQSHFVLKRSRSRSPPTGTLADTEVEIFTNPPVLAQSSTWRRIVPDRQPSPRQMTVAPINGHSPHSATGHSPNRRLSKSVTATMTTDSRGLPHLDNNKSNPNLYSRYATTRILPVHRRSTTTSTTHRGSSPERRSSTAITANSRLFPTWDNNHWRQWSGNYHNTGIRGDIGHSKESVDYPHSPSVHTSVLHEERRGSF